MSNLPEDEEQDPEASYPRHEAPKNFIYNVSIATYHAEPPAIGEFTLFPNLPLELRIKIWHHAISVPRIVEMEKVVCSGPSKHAYGDRWHYRIKNPPPLLRACAESRREALGLYTNQSCPNPPWIRYDYDILHLKVRNERGDPTWYSWFQADDQSGKGSVSAIRDPQIQALAVNWESFLDTTDRADITARSFFPNLKLLIILIVNKVDPKRPQSIEKDAFERYDLDHANNQGRYAFASASTGPFTALSPRNIEYQSYIEQDIDAYFKWAKPNFEGYIAPHVVVMGCALQSTTD